MQETKERRVQSLAGENPLEEEMATTPVFLPGKFCEQRSLVGYSPWVCKESDMRACMHVRAHTHIHTAKSQEHGQRQRKRCLKIFYQNVNIDLSA